MTKWRPVRRYRAAVIRPARRSMKERTGQGTFVPLPRALARFEAQVCVYCRKKGPRLRTGSLAISGPVFFCKKHEAQYQDDKAWEIKYKKQEGL